MNNPKISKPEVSRVAAERARLRVKSQTPERRREVAQKAAAAKWARYRARKEGKE